MGQAKLERLCNCYPSRLSGDYRGDTIPALESFEKTADWMAAVDADMERIEKGF